MIRPTEIAATLDSLKRWYYPLITWPHGDEWWRSPNKTLTESWARFTGYINIPLGWPSVSRWKWDLAREVGDKTGAHIALTYSPGRETWGSTQRDAGTLSASEYLTSLHEIRTVINTYLVGRDPKEVKIVALDHETVYRHPDDIEGSGPLSPGDLRLAAWLDLVHSLIRDSFPLADVLWYGSPHRRRGQGVITRYRGPDVPSLYTPQTPELHKRIYWMSVSAVKLRERDRVIRSPDAKVFPCVSLGSGYLGRRWTPDLSYDPQHDRETGELLHHVPRLRGIWLYPDPFTPGSSATNPGFWEHFWTFYGALTGDRDVLTRESDVSAMPDVPEQHPTRQTPHDGGPLEECLGEGDG